MASSASASRKGRCSLSGRPSAPSPVVTCEHGGNRVPARYARLFRGKGRLLESHRGYDPGALELARKISSSAGCPLFYSTVTRLLVDLNRSPRNPRRFSDVVGRLSPEEKGRVEARYYRPYREAVGEAVEGLVRAGARVLHISVHTFTPSLGGRRREADIGLLYDPGRERELGFCKKWKEALLSIDGSLRVRRNYPYRGTSDGMTYFLRKAFSGNDYMGVEIEVNQKHLGGGGGAWPRLMGAVVASLESVYPGRKLP